MILHNIQNYYFDGYAYLYKKSKFQHLDEKDRYLKSAVKKFIEYFDLKFVNYKKYDFVHEIYKIPKKYVVWS